MDVQHQTEEVRGAVIKREGTRPVITAEVIDGLVQGILKKNFDKPAATPEVHREWWKMCAAPDKYVAIAAPRGHAKSTAITHAYVIANIVFRVKKFILIVSDTETQSTFFLNDIKKELIENDDLREMFGIKGLVKDTDSDFIIEFMDGTKARVVAKGSGQSLRGVKWDNMRPDLIVGDDLENDEIVMNKERRRKFRHWFTGTLVPCLSKDGQIRLVGTILHLDSMLERVMPKRSRKDNTVTELKTVSGPTSIWLAAKYKAHNPDFSKTLWPEYKGAEWLKAERRVYQDQGMLDVWSQEYLNEPMDEASAPFRRGDFKPMEQKGKEKQKEDHYYIGTDFALSLDQQRDYSAFVVGRVTSDNVLQIVHVIKERMQSDEIEEMIFELNRMYKPEAFFFEKGQIWQALSPHLMNGMQERNEYFAYELFASITDKLSRSSAIRSRMRVGAVEFDKEADWYQDFEEECLRFPRAGHDDQVDALAIVGRGLNSFVAAPTKEEQDQDDFEEALIMAGLREQGRNEETGY